MAKPGYGDGKTTKHSIKNTHSKRNPKETSGKGGSYASKKTATTPGGPIEVNKGKAPRSSVRPTSYNNTKAPVVKAKSDPTGTSHHPNVPNLFKKIRDKING
jgi:hypothetical protein